MAGSGRPLVRFKELCMDSTQAPDAGDTTLAEFWAAATGARFQPGPPCGDVVGDEEYQGIAICPVPEAKTVKHRVHLDVYAGSPADLVALGASVLLPAEQSGLRWTVMQDPEGGEFCAFVKDPPPAYRLHGIAVDCADPERVAAWWGDAFGAEPIRNHDGEASWWTLEHVTADPVLTMDFVAVPEPKTVKNRIHWDVYGDPADLLARGASRLWEVPGRTRPVGWTVLADPEGNEFCVFPSSDG
jgi:catechol 2,3-dioxygenase-like lactoylglutathione lyase family enzyme